MWEMLWIFLAVFWLGLPLLLGVALIGSVLLGRVRRRSNARQVVEAALTTGNGEL
jgi:hypothetical protein